MRYKAVVVALAVLLAVAGACGGGGGSSSQLRIVLETHPASGQDVNLDEVVAVLEKRIDAFGFRGGKVDRASGNQVLVDLPPDVDKDSAVRQLTRVGLLELCEPVTDAAGNIAIAQQGTVKYKTETCEPERDAQGNIVVDGGSAQFMLWSPTGTNRDQIVWQPAKGELNGESVALTSRLLEPNVSVRDDPITGQPALIFSFTNEGAQLAQQVTQRLAVARLPLAPFLDGEPLRSEDGQLIAPSVVAVIAESAQVTGLAAEDVAELKSLLNAGALPVPLRLVSAEDSE